MNSIASILPEVRGLAMGTDWLSVLKIALVFCAVLFLLGAVFRAIFGKGSSLTRSVSASISILMVYLAAIALFLLCSQPSRQRQPIALPLCYRGALYALGHCQTVA